MSLVGKGLIRQGFSYLRLPSPSCSVGNLLPSGQYRYTADLLQLDGAKPPSPVVLPQPFSKVVTPLKASAWELALAGHPDEQFVHYLLQGMQGGFRIGFQHGSAELTSAHSNMLSAHQQASVVARYLQVELAQGRVVGPVSPGDAPWAHFSRFGVIPKKSSPGEWRLIVDLSSPQGKSVNDGIPTELCSLQYASVDDAAAVILSLGRNVHLAKLDIKSAYRNVPVHPHDRPLLAMEWEGAVYVDATLPFGLRSAPKIFSALADALEWVMWSRGIRSVLHVHYLDDFLLFGAPYSGECAVALSAALNTCADLGLPVAADKVAGPATTLPFLGIELDTSALQVRLPRDKLRRLQAFISLWRTKKSCTKRELLSLIGHLQHACTVVKPGRTFLRRIIDLSTRVDQLWKHIRLSLAFRADLQWWATFLDQWNGTSMLSCLGKLPTSVTVTSDASGSWGCGAYCGKEWFSVPWGDAWPGVHITVKELLPIVLGISLVWPAHPVPVR